MIDSDKISTALQDAIASINYPAEPARLYQPIKYTMASGGKRLRPTLLLSVMAALGKDFSTGINPALGIEMFHNFTLLHDDVMDGAELRRGQPTVHTRWDVNTAILSGDAMLTMAGMFMSQCEGRHLCAVQALYSKTAMEVYEGQQYDVDYECRTDVTVSQYLEMIRLKTSVLLACACKMGAILSDADEATCEAFYEYGIKLGLGFQLQDDRLDTYGDPVIFGKQIGGDIINEKKTWLLISALNLDKSGELASILGSSIGNDEKVERVRAIYDRLGLNEQSKHLIETYAADAIAAISKVELAPEERDYFIKLAESLTQRNF